jgi:mycothiol system anti-sigma-R factor
VYDCSTVRNLVYLHLDGELDAEESLRVQEHLDACSSCREIFVAERWIHTVSIPSITKMSAPDSLRRRIISAMAEESPRMRRWSHQTAAAAAVVLVVTAVVACWVALRKPPHVPRLLDLAVAQHERYAPDSSGLLIESHDTATVAARLEAQLPFRLGLPPEPVDSVTLSGGTVLSMDQSKVAFLSYRVNGVPVSLLLTTPLEVMAPIQDIVTFKNIVFHSGRLHDYHTLQWSDRRFTYVLVSQQQEATHQACVICHGSPQGRQAIAGFL